MEGLLVGVTRHALQGQIHAASRQDVDPSSSNWHGCLPLQMVST